MGPKQYKDALIRASSADDVVRTRAFDTIANSFRPLKWPAPFDSSGVLRNEATNSWDNDDYLEKALSTHERHRIIETFQVASEKSDPTYTPVYAGKGVGKIYSIDKAFDILSRVEQETITTISTLNNVLPKGES